MLKRLLPITFRNGSVTICKCRWSGPFRWSIAHFLLSRSGFDDVLPRASSRMYQRETFSSPMPKAHIRAGPARPPRSASHDAAPCLFIGWRPAPQRGEPEIVCEIIREADLRAESTHYDVPKPRTDQELVVLPAPDGVLLFSGALLRRAAPSCGGGALGATGVTGPRATAARWRCMVCPLEVSPRTAPRSYA